MTEETETEEDGMLRKKSCPAVETIPEHLPTNQAVTIRVKSYHLLIFESKS